jgi:hypothetical protein
MPTDIQTFRHSDVSITMVCLRCFAKALNQVTGVLPTGISWLRIVSSGALIKKRGKIAFP